MQKNPLFGENYSINFKIFLNKLLSVKMFLTRGKFAWDKLNYSSLSYQRLNVIKPNDEWFEQWLCGMTDGDGSFSILNQGNKWNLTFKISQNTYNLRVLYYIKKQLGVGKVSIESNRDMASFRIRDRNTLKNIIFPIFDKYPLLTTKYFNYVKFKEAYNILENSKLTQLEKNKLIKDLKSSIPYESYISPAWDKITLPLINSDEAYKVMSKPWLIGFIEAESSFYLVSKTSDRIVHGFGITKKLDGIILESIRHILHISTQVLYKQKYNYYILDTTNSRAIENICKYFFDTMKGMKSLEYKIWARSFYKHKGNFEKLSVIKKSLQRLRKKNKKKI